MRPDNDLGLGSSGSARVSRAGFGVAPKKSSVARFIILGPEPLIVFILFGHPCIPRISQNVAKLFLKIAIRSYIPIEPFLLPNRSALVFDFINFMR